MAVYLIAEVKDIVNKAKYDEYSQKIPPTLKKFGGQYLARGGKITVASGDWNPSWITMIKFESIDKFNAWWHSPEYKAIAMLREKSSRTNVVVVEGV